MSVATEIARIQTDRNTIRNKLIDFVLAESTSNLDALATAGGRDRKLRGSQRPGAGRR